MGESENYWTSHIQCRCSSPLHHVESLHYVLSWKFETLLLQSSMTLSFQRGHVRRRKGLTHSESSLLLTLATVTSRTCLLNKTGHWLDSHHWWQCFRSSFEGKYMQWLRLGHERMNILECQWMKRTYPSLMDHDTLLAMSSRIWPHTKELASMGQGDLLLLFYYLLC